MKGTFFLLLSAVIMMTYLDYAEAVVMCYHGGDTDYYDGCVPPADKSCMSNFTTPNAQTNGCSDKAITMECREGEIIYCPVNDCNAKYNNSKIFDLTTVPCTTGSGTPTAPPNGSSTAAPGGTTDNKGFSVLTLLALSAIPFKVLSN